LKSEIETSGICILHAPLFHTALKNFSGIRKDMQFKTFFNMLGPLINPSQPNKQLVGVYCMELADLYAGIYKQTDKEFSIIHSLDGYDEVSLTGSYRIIKRGSDEILKPETSGFKKLNASTISGGNTIIESAKIFHDILNCEGTREQQDVVIANASLAINCYYPDLSITDSIAMAKESLLSKRALKSFQKLMN
jgi:anthranilate phosphoribosyltransferase